ncbi:MAG TPA: CoA ester lyase [Actinobacteria bacterium]|nr:CoA ester lyase [Actinomycetota bacterium]
MSSSRRSCLAVPGSSDRMILKAQSLTSDMVFLDLEDAVAPAAKAEARDRVTEALVQGQWGQRIRSVRINAVGTPWGLSDLVSVMEGAGEHLDTIMLPKVSTPAHVHWADASLTMLEQSLGLPVGTVGVEIQIEDAKGLTEVDAIASASPRNRALHFGPGDFQASMGIPSVAFGRLSDAYPGDPMHHVFGRLLVAARAHGLQVLDGPFLAIKDIDGLRASAQRAGAMGLDGKWVLHPDQVETVNAVFTPTQEEFDRAERILVAYEAAISPSGGARGAVLLDDEMIDEASRAMALVVTARGRAAGLTAHGGSTGGDGQIAD